VINLFENNKSCADDMVVAEMLSVLDEDILETLAEAFTKRIFNTESQFVWKKTREHPQTSHPYDQRPDILGGHKKPRNTANDTMGKGVKAKGHTRNLPSTGKLYPSPSSSSGQGSLMEAHGKREFVIGYGRWCGRGNVVLRQRGGHMEAEAPSRWYVFFREQASAAGSDSASAGTAGGVDVEMWSSGYGGTIWKRTHHPWPKPPREQAIDTSNNHLWRTHEVSLLEKSPTPSWSKISDLSRC
jgi:hypothetical protein